MLSDNDIQDATTNAVRARKLSWLGFKKDEQGEYVIPVLSPSNFQFARAIESAATSPLLARIAELTRELEEARKDAEMLDWLDNNIFAREPDEWDQRYGVCRDGKTQIWAIFAPKGVHGSARRIIDAAIKEQT